MKQNFITFYGFLCLVLGVFIGGSLFDGLSSISAFGIALTIIGILICVCVGCDDYKLLKREDIINDDALKFYDTFDNAIKSVQQQYAIIIAKNEIAELKKEIAVLKHNLKLRNKKHYGKKK